MTSQGAANPDRSANRRPTAPVRAASALLVAMFATWLILVSPGPAAGQDGADGSADIVAVEFDLGDDSGEGDTLQPVGPTEPVSYRSVTVTHGGHEIRLAPAAEPSIADFRGPGLDRLVPVSFGSVVEASAEGAAQRLAASLSSGYVHESIWLRDGGATTFEVRFTKPLAVWDFFLIQEASGDASVGLAALPVDGGDPGPATTGGGYDWNTGYPTSTDVDGRQWATVVSVASLPGGGQGIAGLSVTAPAGADLKIVPLEVMATLPAADGEEPDGGGDGDGSDSLAGSEASTGDGPASGQNENETAAGGIADETGDLSGDTSSIDGGSDEASVAAVGLRASFRPGISLEGASCVDPALEGALPVALPGDQATYCFSVTNLGTTPLDEVRISDRALGFENTLLPLAIGAVPIAPGETSVFYHHNTISGRAADAVTSVTADPGGAGELAPPRAESADLTAVLGPSADADDGPQAEQAGGIANPDPSPTDGTDPAPAPGGGDEAGTGAQTGDGSGSGHRR